MKQKISVVINTLNEERNLPYALRSIHSWADEIVVVDMHSEDRTVEIAKQYGAKVYFHERIAAFDGARQFAIEQANNDWVLLLDADELVPEPLSRTLIDMVASDQFDVVTIPRLNFLLGVPLMHTGWGPDQDKHPRLFKKDKLTISATIHEFITPTEGATILEIKYDSGMAIVHFNYTDTTHFIEKLNRYTTVEAQQAHERGERASVITFIYKPIKEFLNRYLRKGGFRDGWRGFYLSFAMAFYRISILSKIKELEVYESRETILKEYANQANRILAQYQGDDSERG
ncbi:glycosyltransferase family 2 protein [Acidithiobacillus ferriphilus]|uniref:glycosyltransferase family 2 protein n=1 Tax=Acidithiobacillus ferriphilus TaxID=1689834 RepID=UPI001C074FAE|nr:glycosyltransferase family 2 protein [Acidithiobacillus ferriphilus]MBU2833734.1 glycosyltransferase family 2 protein [Acidithiobacillus ferriphilus]